jgi:hypothetical protein
MNIELYKTRPFLVIFFKLILINEKMLFCIIFFAFKDTPLIIFAFITFYHAIMIF